MTDNVDFKIIAKIRTDFPTKFGIPRQSGIIPAVKGLIVFEPEYRDSAALRGIEGFSHIWILWKFSEAVTEKWSPTVRPPRLGGNKRMGVFATRSPFRPNPIGLSSVKLEKVLNTADKGTVLEVSGVDLMDNTPIYDIKPYIPFTDLHTDATGGFSETVYDKSLEVEISDEVKKDIPCEVLTALKEIIANDPRPAYQNDQNRIYSFCYADFNIKFTVASKTAKVILIEKT